MNLKRRAASAAMLVLLFTAAYANTQSQARQGATYAKPAEVALERRAKRLFRGYYKNYRGQNFLVESFYPIGWSKDGKFAYYTEPVDEACGCYFANLYITDLKTDKVLWSFDYDSEDEETAREKKRPFSMTALWNANRRLFSDKLREHGIEPRGRFALLSFPAGTGKDLIAADLRLTESKKEEDRVYGIVQNVRLDVVSKLNGRKTVLNQNYGQDARPLYVGTVGYLKSPFEQRIAVVLIEINRGYEGPPNVGSVKIVGAELETGFK